MIKPLSMIFSIALTLSAYSDDLYSIKITSPDSKDIITNTYTNFDDVIEATKLKNITLKGYTKDSEATITMMLGSTPATMTFAAGETDLNFSMSNCNVNETFSSGTTRAANQNSFSNFLKNNKDRALSTISGCLIRDNPHNPVAATYRSLAKFGKTLTDTSNPDENQERFSGGLVAGHFSTRNQSHSIITLPLSYTHYFKESGRRLKLTAPLSYIDVNGSKAYKGSLGVTYTRPVNNRWTIIPATSLGITASKDMKTAATIASVFVTNVYEFPYKNKHITLANMAGVLKTLDVEVGRFKSYYDLKNQVIKNGIAVELPQTYKMFGGKTSIQASLANTQFFGDKIRVDNYTDIALSFGTRRKVGGKDNSQDSIQLGLTYTVGNHGYKGGKLNFGYKF